MIVEYCFGIIFYLLLFAFAALMIIGFVCAGVCFVAFFILATKEPLAYLKEEIQRWIKRKD